MAIRPSISQKLATAIRGKLETCEGLTLHRGEEQAIVAVGLAPPKAGVFLEAIEYVLVIATTVEVVLLGVCLEAGAYTRSRQS
jgi:hypothetical protein